MSERDNLIRILRTRIWPKEGADPAEVVADLLLDNGVRFATVVRPGTTVYTTDGVRVYEATVRKVMYDCGYFGFDEDALGKSVFLCREAAEAAAESWGKQFAGGGKTGGQNDADQH